MSVATGKHQSDLFGISLAAALCAALLASPAPAGINLWPNCWHGKCGGQKRQIFDTTTQALIWQLSHNPALMNVEYLKFYIGRPENEELTAGPERHYYWYDAERQPAYELIQREEAPGKVTESNFIARLSGMGLTFDKLDKFYGSCSRRFYDYSGHPNELFTFAPDTFLSFACPPNSFLLSQAKIIYRGQALPAPPTEEMAAAETAMLARAQLAKDRKVSDQEIIPVLIARVRTQPEDPEAHLLLAQALQRRARIHEAIGEYKLALALSGSNQDVQNQALDALRSLKLTEQPQTDERRNLEIVDNGQRIRVVGKEKKSNKNDNAFTANSAGNGPGSTY